MTGTQMVECCIQPSLTAPRQRTQFQPSWNTHGSHSGKRFSGASSPLTTLICLPLSWIHVARFSHRNLAQIMSPVWQELSPETATLPKLLARRHLILLRQQYIQPQGTNHDSLKQNMQIPFLSANDLCRCRPTAQS